MILMMILSLVMFCQNCKAVRSDLVGRVAIVSNPGTESHSVLISIFAQEIKISLLLRIMNPYHSQQPRWRLHQTREVPQPCCPSTRYKVFLCLKMLQLYISKCYNCTLTNATIVHWQILGFLMLSRLCPWTACNDLLYYTVFVTLILMVKRWFAFSGALPGCQTCSLIIGTGF